MITHRTLPGACGLVLVLVVVLEFACGGIARAQDQGRPAPERSPLPSGQPIGPAPKPGQTGPVPLPGETAPPPTNLGREPRPGPATAPGAPLPGVPAAKGRERRVLALALKEAIVRGLRNNPDLAIDRLSAEITEAGIRVPEAEFEPIVFADGTFGKNRDPFFAANPFPDLSVNPVTGLPAGLIVNPSARSHLDGGARTKTVLGTTIEMRYDVDRQTTESTFALSTAYTPVASIVVSQPLPFFRGFGWEVNRAFINIARNDFKISEAAFKSRALDVAFSVEQAYWGFVFARENLKVAELALETARDLLEINRRKFQVGRVAEIEVLVAETGVATRQDAVITARNEVQNARDNLFRLIMPPRERRPGGASPESYARAWDVELIALDEPRAEEVVIDVEGAFLAALRNRPDYAQIELALDSDEIRLDRAANERMPRFDATGSWSQIGLGKSWGGGTREQLDGKFYEWQIGFAFEVPMFNTAARAQYRQAELTRAQTRKRLQALEQSIVLEVRTAARDIIAARERERASDTARQLAERQLDNEKQRLVAGLATNHDVLLFEQDLTAARTNYVKAQIDRAVAAARLERVKATLLERHDIRIASE